MERHGKLGDFIHRNFLWLLLGSYLVAAVSPSFGLWIRDVSFGEIAIFNDRTRLALPMLMLAFLLLNAGLGVQTGEMRNILRRPWVLGAGLAANFAVPIAFIFVVAQTMRWWHNPEEVQHILVGLALVAAMPIAGSSTAWTQNANGNVSLGLGLVLFSTFLSPLTTPVTFELVEQMATGEYARALDDLETKGTGVLLLFCVLLPSLVGIGLHYLLGPARVQAGKSKMKLANTLNLLLLNYSNTSISLPQAIANPDVDFLAVILVIVLALCGIAFLSGWLVARLLKTDPARRISLMFALGMNNNGTGLVLASMMLGHYPQVLLPIIFYNLVQHLVAGTVDFTLFRRPPQPLSDAEQQPVPEGAPTTEITLVRRVLLARS